VLGLNDGICVGVPLDTTEEELKANSREIVAGRYGRMMGRSVDCVLGLNDGICVGVPFGSEDE